MGKRVRRGLISRAFAQSLFYRGGTRKGQARTTGQELLRGYQEFLVGARSRKKEVRGAVHFSQLNGVSILYSREISWTLDQEFHAVIAEHATVEISQMSALALMDPVYRPNRVKRKTKTSPIPKLPNHNQRTHEPMNQFTQHATEASGPRRIYPSAPNLLSGNGVIGSAKHRQPWRTFLAAKVFLFANSRSEPPNLCLGTSGTWHPLSPAECSCLFPRASPL
jgi:hypothetical protein